MKKIINTLTFIALLLALNTGCNKKIDEAYANPNADVRVPVESLLPGIISSMAANGGGHGSLNSARYIGKYIQNWQFAVAGTRGVSNLNDQMGYYINTDSEGSIWRMHYYDIGQNAMRMIDWASEEKKWDYAGVGQAILAWSWLTLTDYHGDVILKEAFNTSLLTFKYDTQQEVYEFVRQLSFKALENLNKTGDAVNQSNLAKGDKFFFNGDVNKWKKFVYGILARYHHHQTNKPNYNADSVVYYADKSILSHTDNGYVQYEYAGGSSSAANFFGPLRGNFTTLVIGTNTSETVVRQSAFIANLMSGINTRFANNKVDPRAIYLLRLNNNGTFKGLTPNKGQLALPAGDRPENFYGVSQFTTSTSTPTINTAPANDNASRFIFTNTAPTPILTSTEIHFIKAEALFRKNDKAGALASYKQAISEHFDMLTTVYNKNIPLGKEITAASKAAFLADPVIVPDASSLTLSHIMLQKYIALWGHGILETWVDLRRYHYIDKDANGQQVYTDFAPPADPTDLFPDNKGKYVYRVRPRYNSEYVWNKNELIRIGADLPDYHTKETWFSMR